MYSNRPKKIEYRYEYKQKDAAKILGIPESIYSRYKKNKKTMPIKHLNTICNYYNISIDYIFELTEKEKYSTSKPDINRELMANRLKEFRKENKLTQIKLAQILNIANGTIGEYEKGTYLISTTCLYTICKKYNISADYLLGKIDEPKYLK